MRLQFYPDDQKQRRLIERYLLSVSAYVLCVSIAWVAKVAGLTSLSGEAMVLSSVTILLYVIGIYFVYRTGLNRRMVDSVFTRLQMLVAIAWISFFVWSTQELRGAMLLIYIFVAMFSIFTLTPWQTAVVGVVISLVYATVIFWDWWNATAGFDLMVNVIQWGIVSAALIWLVAIAKYISGVRDKLARSSKMIRLQNTEIQRTNEQLESALGKLKHMVITDELTGLSNRRHFLETINVHIESCHNDQFEFGLCMLDLDNFKTINDTFGHQVGDQVLRIAAELMRQNMREYDFLARFGGEEFVLIVTRGDEAVTSRCAERLRYAMAGADLSDLAQGMSLTVSIGATVFRPGDSLQTALDRADAGLYQAKQAGRNTCVMRLAEELAAAN